jgi:hypothetical protein
MRAGSPFIRSAAIVIAALSLSAASTDEAEPVRTGPCPEAKGGWCEFVQNSAARTWLYAQMSQNAYDANRPEFRLPDTITAEPRVGNDGIDFAYRIYRRHEGAKLTEVIVAFRGTEGLGDWWYGNLLGRQNRRGLAVVRDVFQDLADRGLDHVEVSVTGHSLGGGIAHYVSLRDVVLRDGQRRAVTRSYVFNNSPRYWRGKGSHEVERIATVEYGEVLKLVRAPATEASQTYVSLNCRSNRANVIRDHAMDYLARCLTWIAGFKDDEARQSIRSNAVARPQSQVSSDDPLASGMEQVRAIPEREPPRRPGKIVKATVG